jgi:hypothetical protein
MAPAEQQSSPHNGPPPGGQQAPAGFASSVAHTGASDGHPPPAQGLVEPAGGVAGWPGAVHVVVHVLDFAQPGGPATVHTWVHPAAVHDEQGAYQSSFPVPAGAQ